MTDYIKQTISYYDENYAHFIGSTVDVQFSGTQNKFLFFLKNAFPNFQNEQIQILDFGCGSGRDAKYFLEKGFDVTATDGSEKICAAASKFLGRQVHKLFFDELCDEKKYHGVWACSSVLHLDKKKLVDVFEKISVALKGNGIFYTSFKLGTFEGIRNGRYFCDMTAEKFSDFLADVNFQLQQHNFSFAVIDKWQSFDARKNRETEKWLNIILQKK